MTPTDELRTELRELIDEEIPDGGSDADTAFKNERIDSLLRDALSLHAAAAEGWRRKGSQIQKRLGDIQSYQVGSERYDFVNLTTALNAALAMAKTYDELAGKKSGGSFMLGVKPPEVT